MIIPIFVLFGIIATLFLFEKDDERPNIFTSSAIFIMMLLIITFRSIEMRDAGNYISNFTGHLEAERFEPGYQLLRDMTRVISSNYRFLFFVIGAIALAIKFKAIQVASPLFFGSLLIYLSNYFVLHDMIQIRAGIASGLFIFAVKFIAEQRVKPFIFTSILAICFHYSSLILIPLWFISKINIPRWLLALSMPISFGCALFGITIGNSISLIPISFVQTSYQLYQMSMELGNDTEISILNVVVFAKAATVIFMMLYFNRISINFPYLDKWLKVYVAGIVIFFFCSDIPVVSFRISEFLLVSEIILVPLIADVSAKKIFSKSIVILYALILLLITTLYSRYLM